MSIGIILKKWTTIRFMNVVPDYFIYKIALVGKDDKYGEGVHRNVDGIVVLEEKDDRSHICRWYHKE